MQNIFKTSYKRKKEVIIMDFQSACRFCYKDFKEDYNTGIGTIKDCGEFWIFYKKPIDDVTEYGSLPIIVYKDDREPIYMTFDKFMELIEQIENSPKIEVPKEFF